MKIPPWLRLILYALAAAWPIWIDWITKSNDTTFRGLLMPILSSLNAITVVILARTTSTGPADEPPKGENRE